MLSLISAISFYLKHDFHQLLNIYIPTVLKLTTRANKVYISLSTNTLKTCVENSCLPAIITILVESLKNSPSKSQRIACQELLCFTLMKNDRLAILPLVQSVEEGLTIGILDSCSQVRDKCRNLFDLYKSMFRERVEAFVNASTPVAQKYFKVTRFESQRENSIEKKYGIERDVVERNLFVKFTRSSNQLATSTNGDSKGSQNPEQDTVDLSKSHDTPRNILLAQRVPKAVKSATKRFLQPAQRIIQVDVESTVDMKSDSSVAEKPVGTSKVKSPKAPSPRKNLDFTLNESSKIPLTKSKVSLSSTNILALESGLKDSNWSKRVDCVKRITEYLNTAQTIDYSNPNAAKLYSMIVKGLSDAHFKVILTALESLMSIVNPSIPQQHLGTLLAPVLSLATSGQKQKPSIGQLSHSVLQLILKKCDPGSLAFALNQCLQNVTSFPRVKLGVLNYISTFQPNQVKSIFENKTSTSILM